MRIRSAFFLVAWVVVPAALAQTVPAATDKSDSWAKPAVASTAATSYRSQALPGSRDASSPFKFKNDSGRLPVDQPPPSATDKASVMGTDRPWQNGKPPVDCAMAPQSAGCRN